MAGYIVELYKNVRSAEGYQPMAGKNKGSRPKIDFKRRTYVTYGDFDKMAISKVTAFSRMRDMSELSRTWIGDRQTILLYEISEDNEVFYTDYMEEEGFYLRLQNGTVQKSENLFIAVSVLQFKESPDGMETDMDVCLRTCRQNILQLVVQEHKETASVHCSVFGILGSYGLAILWASDQFVEILRIINRIKGIDVKKDTATADYDFLSFFTILAKNNLSDELVKSKLEKVKGMAMLQITLQSNLSAGILEEFNDKIQSDQFFHSVGEHDLIITSEARRLFQLYGHNQLLDPDEPFYRKNILQTNMRFYEELTIEDVESEPEQESTPILPQADSLPSHLNDFIKKVEKCYKDLREKFYEHFPKTAGMVDSLDLLYGDFVSKISSVSNRMWAYDFGYQFLAILDVIKKYLGKILNKEIDVPTSEALADFREVLNCYEYQIIHIAESNNLVIDTPKCHLRYTGQNNLTLYAYFGITKDIIKLCYIMQGMSRQSRIMPLISVDIVPIIESTMYIDYGIPDEDRVLKLNLPMTALYNLPDYIPYLYHEIFHYVVPKDRVVRNWMKGICLSVVAIHSLLRSILYSCSDMNNVWLVEGLAEYVFLPFIYNSVFERYYDGLAEEIRGDHGREYTIKEIDSRALEWKQYEKELFEGLINSVSEPKFMVGSNNLPFEVLDDLFLQKKEIKNAVEKFINNGNNMERLGGNAQVEASSIIGSLMGRLEALHNNVNDQAKAQAFYGILQKAGKVPEYLISIDELESISIALSEVGSDIPMVELAEMKPVHYLISYIKIQNDLLRTPTEKAHIQDDFRIGIILDFIMGFDKAGVANFNKLHSYLDEFIQLYVGLYYSTKKSKGDFAAYLCECKKRAEKWFCWITDCYSRYMKASRIYIPMFEQIAGQSSIRRRRTERCDEVIRKMEGFKSSEYYELLKVYGAGIIHAIEQTPPFQKEQITSQLLSQKESFDAQVFQMNIRLIQIYQRQDNFGSIDKIREESLDTSAYYVKDAGVFTKKYPILENQPLWDDVEKRRGTPNVSYEISDIEELCCITEEIARKFSWQSKIVYGTDEYAIWYRGHSKNSYKLLPSAMRKYAALHDRKSSLLTYQREAYEEFKFRMDQSSDRIDKAGYTVCDYLALMQHYHAPTIYMDWSENALSALYFAMEDYIDPTKNVGHHNEDAVLYMLHPNLYNKARNEVIKLFEGGTGCALDKLLKETVQTRTNSLPNLSVAYNQKRYSMFLLGEEVETEDIPDPQKKKFWTLSQPIGSEYLYLPLAIYSSRANARIRTQFGMFMAFNIFTPLGEGDNFNYLALENIQDFYLERFEKAKPFLYKIVIKHGSKKQIAEWLKTIGVSKSMIYPELSSIGEGI